jgi:hypothetical protein
MSSEDKYETLEKIGECERRSDILQPPPLNDLKRGTDDDEIEKAHDLRKGSC